MRDRGLMSKHTRNVVLVFRYLSFLLKMSGL